MSKTQGARRRRRSAACDPEKLFLQATAFQEAKDVLSKRMTTAQGGVVLMAPTCVLSAFASELLLKCLICLERGYAPEGHDLLVLFNMLATQTRDRLKEMWANHTQTYRDKVEEAERLTGIKFETDLTLALKAGRNTFNLLRYMHEGHKEEYAFYLGALPHMLGRVAFELRPEWARRAKKEWEELQPRMEMPPKSSTILVQPFSDAKASGQHIMIYPPTTTSK
jgi:HEPN domain-containing protein